MPLWRLYKTLSYYFTGYLLRFKAKRYRNLFRIIKENKCKKIMEIGTWNGNHAVEMIKSASANFTSEEIEYYGFDLFEEATPDILEEEFSSAKKPPSLLSVKSKLNKTGAKIFLFKGNTIEELPKIINQLPNMDFIFIDGGHSIQTIRNDWENVQRIMDKNTIVIFDDYFNIYNFGCKKIIDNIDRKKFKVGILLPKDKFRKKWGILEINFVKVNKI